MITTSVDVEGSQVETVRIVLWPVQVVLHIRRYEWISILGSLANETTQDGVHLAFIKAEGVKEEFP